MPTTSGPESNLPLINEFLKTGQTEQPWHEVIGCWTFEAMKGRMRNFFSPQGGEIGGLTIPDRRAPKEGAKNPRRGSAFLTSLVSHSWDPDRKGHRWAGGRRQLLKFRIWKRKAGSQDGIILPATVGKKITEAQPQQRPTGRYLLEAAKKRHSGTEA